MSSTPECALWDAVQASPFIAVPLDSDNKYSRGVLGVVTGSKHYPGAAILSVEAAHSTGVGMVRYHGPRRAANLVLARRPETVTVAGQVNAWLIGSGTTAETRGNKSFLRLQVACESGCPIVIDAGALDLVSSAKGCVVVTPHARELASLLLSRGSVSSRSFTSLGSLTVDISANPSSWSQAAADELGVTVLLKGNVTHVATPADERGTRFHARVVSPTTWLATAGTGDILAGILGALVATHAGEVRKNSALLGPLAATAALLHGLAADRASRGGPLAALDVAEALPLTIAGIL